MADPNFRLQKGKFIDVQKGFVDAFNYVYENVNGIKGGQGVEIDKSMDGAWQINADQSIDGDGGDGNAGEAVYDVTEDTRDEKDGLLITYTDERTESFIPWPDGIVDLTADSNNISAQFDAANQDYLTVTSSDGSTLDIPLPYVNGVADLSVISSDQDNDRQLTWTYTRSTLSVEPIDLGVEFTDDSQSSSTGLHTEFVLKSAEDSNVEFTFDGKEITIGVYYI